MGYLPKAEKLICDSENITYDKGYIALWLENFELPSAYNLNGEILSLKTSLHVSLLCVKNITEAGSELEGKILNLFCTFLQDNKICFQEATGELKLIIDAERNRKSVIAMCTVQNLEKFILQINERLDVKVSMQPAHITLYTLGENLGIGVDSFDKLKEMSTSIEIPELLEVLGGLK